MTDHIDTKPGFDFVTRRELVEASKKLAASDGLDTALYTEVLAKVGKIFAQSMGVTCSVQLLVDQASVEQALKDDEAINGTED